MQRMIVSRPAGELRGRVALPASKYHAHRALILASLAEGTSTIQGRTAAEHVRSTLDVLRRLGTGVRATHDGYEVTGGPYRPSTTHVSAGSSGSTLQFLLGLLCRSAGGGPLVFDGMPALRRRPIGPLLQGLSALGVRLEAEGDRLPVRVYPGRPAGGRVAIGGTLSQWISGLMLLGPLCSRDVEIDVQPPVNERPYLDLTVRMMGRFGVRVEATEPYTRLAVAAGQRYLPAEVVLPPDMSSAAYLLGAAACLPGSVTFANIDARPDHPEGEILRILRDMGAAMAFSADKRELRIGNHGVRLQAIRYDCTDTPDLIPILAVLCAVARGRSVLEHVGHARLKESDRVGAMLQLRRMGARIEQEGERLLIDGVEHLRSASIDACDDHRVLMAFAVAGACAEGGDTDISHGAAYRISYPQFLEHAAALGLPASVPDSRRQARATSLPAAWQERYRKSGLQPGRLITDYLAEDAAWTPERPAVVDTSRGTTRVLTYAALAAHVDRLATGLIGLGVQPGEVVAFQLPNWWEFAVLQLALARIGAISCPLMPILRQRELSFMLGRTEARLLVVPSRFRGVDYPAMIAGIRPQLPKLQHVLVVGEQEPDDPAAFGELLGCAPDPALLAARRPKPRELTQLLYTSGTSGEPKGVLHTHDSLLASLVAHGRHFRLTDRDNVWVPSPCGHQTGFLYGLWLSTFLGSTGVYQDIWDAERGAEIIDRHEARFVQAATPFLSDLTEVCARRGRPPESLRIFVAAGAPIPRGLAHRARQQLRVEVLGAWGTTESGLCTAGSLAEPPDRLWQTDGRALAGTGTRIVDEQGKDLPAGAEGQFLVWTPGMFVGYFGHPDWYAASFQEDGWFRTGDLGRMDADGYIRITGRIKDVIIRGGEKIPVAEVEELLHAHPAVAEAAVVAMPDPRLGERACAFLVLRPGHALDMPGLQAYLAEAGMAKTYWPERLEAIAAMPRTPSGKIQKFLLRERLQPAAGVRAGS